MLEFDPDIRRLGRVDYEPTWRAMQRANRERSPDTRDELWLLEHPPVFTLGLAGRPEHVLAPGEIPVVKIDRGGQVTYHGPGQAVVYLMLDLRRLGYGVKELVRRLEEAVIRQLAGEGIDAVRLAGMPGVYVASRAVPRVGPFAGHAKIAAIGLRVANHATYHGIALNVDLDLEPFARITPCGYEGLGVTRLADLGVGDNVGTAGEKLLARLQETIRE